MAAAFINRNDRYRFGSVGLAIDVIECKIAPDGEVLMRGPTVFRSYHGNPTATAEAIDAEGWFHSGDIGELEDGFLRDHRPQEGPDRPGGRQEGRPSGPGERPEGPLPAAQPGAGFRRPETVLVALVTLSEEAVQKYGAGDGNKAAANPECKALIAKQIDAFNASLASFETIKRFDILVEDFTEANGQLTPSLKVKRKEAVARHRSVIDGLYDRAESA